MSISLLQILSTYWGQTTYKRPNDLQIFIWIAQLGPNLGRGSYTQTTHLPHEWDLKKKTFLNWNNSFSLSRWLEEAFEGLRRQHQPSTISISESAPPDSLRKFVCLVKTSSFHSTIYRWSDAHNCRVCEGTRSWSAGWGEHFKKKNLTSCSGFFYLKCRSLVA